MKGQVIIISIWNYLSLMLLLASFVAFAGLWGGLYTGVITRFSNQ
jgi:hypothetical protein